MLYNSTRSGLEKITSANAIKMGIAPDGGLYVPEKLPTFTMEQIAAMKDLKYGERAYLILKEFLTDYTREELVDAIKKAYNTNKFDHEDIVPLVGLNSQVDVLELFHGPTCAFKDMALQILPYLMVDAMKKTNEADKIVILVATSGDTGKAALEGFKDVEGTYLIVFFPNGGVSEVQRLQMVTQEGNNLKAISVGGNFDDAQTGVKQIFSDAEMAKGLKAMGYKFSSANSINWGRLVPQIVYYFSAYGDLLKKKEINVGDKINFVVPTGNFGNILAAYYAMEMGLPVNRLICASNENNVLTDFINTGVYDRKRDFKKTLSPSMDILISSNLERLLYFISGQNTTQVGNWMETLNHDGAYTISSEYLKKIQSVFWAGFSSDLETMKTIESIYDEYGYVCDTHTAVAIDVYDKYVISTSDMTKTVIVSTASPFKFNESVVESIKGKDAIKGKTEIELLKLLSESTKLPVPSGLQNLDQKEVLHTAYCERDEMKSVVEATLAWYNEM